MTDSAALRRAYPPSAAIDMQPLRDGWPVRRFIWPPDVTVAGSILFAGGRGDIFEKYLETFAHWHDRGWHVTAFDWRGQGGSGRLGADPRLGHIDRFATWIDDLAEETAAWRARTSGPHVAIGHSMGGHLLLRGLAEGRLDLDAAVLVAPMLGFETAGVPLPIAAAAVRIAARLAPTRFAWKSNERPASANASRQQFLTGDAERYADELWWKREHPELDLGPPSLNWLAEANASCRLLAAPGTLERIGTPILILGTWGDRLVSPAAIAAAATRLGNGDLMMFDRDVGHEILRERDGPRGAALARIDAFLDRVKGAA